MLPLKLLSKCLISYRWATPLVLLFPIDSIAFPGLISPSLPGLYSYECLDCHVVQDVDSSCNFSSNVHPQAPCLNSFGKTYMEEAWSNALRDADEDGDSVTNGDELNTSFSSAGLLAGAESVSCDMQACSANVGVAMRCGTSYVHCTASFNDTPAPNYSFAFTCEQYLSPVPIITDKNWDDKCVSSLDSDGDSFADIEETIFYFTDPEDNLDYPGNGDPNKNYEVDAGDVLLCMQAALQDTYDARCDVTTILDYEVNTRDVIIMMRRTLGAD